MKYIQFDQYTHYKANYILQQNTFKKISNFELSSFELISV